MRIVFMGTPDFAVASLEALCEAEGIDVAVVVTMPDKPVGRHQQTLQASAVKRFAVERGIPVLQPEKLRDEAFLAELSSFGADLQVVVAFRMLPEVVWAMPRLGTFNLHASLLPQYRGAAPINWAIINGETRTGVTTFFLDREIDTGLIIHQRETPVLFTDNAESLHDRLMQMGAELVVETVRDIEGGQVTPFPQSRLLAAEDLRPAPKLNKENCQLIPERHTALSAYNFVRGLSPVPAAWTWLDGKRLKIFASEPQQASELPPAGTIDTDGRSLLRIACLDGWLSLLSLQLEGHCRMTAEEFLRGWGRK